MNHNFHQLKVFAAVVEEQGISAAARKLCMTQPAVSIQVKQLEAHYGLSLIEVIGKKIFLTQAGQQLYETFLKIRNELSYLEEDFSQRQGCLKGQLNLAIVSTAKYFIPKLLGEFHHRYPQIDIHLKVMNRTDIIERLRKNFDDLVVMSQPPENLAIYQEPLLNDEMVICSPHEHPLADLDLLELAQLSQEPFIIRESGSGTRMTMERFFTQNRFKPKIVMELGSSSAIKQAIIAGFGLSFISKMSIHSELQLKQIKILNVVNLPIDHRWYAVHLKGKTLAPAAVHFLELLRSQAQVNPISI